MKKTQSTKAAKKITKPSKYRKEFCQKLIDHMAKGFSFKSFGAEVNVCKATLDNWKNAHPEFRAAHARAECFLERYLMEMGHRISTGNLTRLEREEPYTDTAGKPVFDVDGKPVMRRFYTATKGNAASWIFTTRNCLHWSNVDTIRHAGPGAGEKPVEMKVSKVSSLTDAELVARYKDLIKKGIVPNK